MVANLTTAPSYFAGGLSVRSLVAGRASVLTGLVDLHGKRYPLKVNADGYLRDGDSLPMSERLVIRVETQGGGGCALHCRTCQAGDKLGINHTVDCMTAQVIETIGALGYGPPTPLYIFTFGLGETLVNVNVPEFFAAVHALYPNAEFTISTSGPKALKLAKRILDRCIELTRQGVRITLQVSVHTVMQAFRSWYMKEKPAATVEELANEIGAYWTANTLSPLLANFVVGPDMVNAWVPESYDVCTTLYPPDRTTIKLSPEGGAGGAVWMAHQYQEVLDERTEGFRRAGYTDIFVYQPPGFEVGGSCAVT